MQNQYTPLLSKLLRYSLLGIAVQCLVAAPIVVPAATRNSTLHTSHISAINQQESVVTGKVVGSDNPSEGIPGVNVLIKGTAVGTTTDAEGKYSLQVSDQSAVLVFSFIGYAAQEVPVSGRAIIDVTLGPDVQQLNEVVVVAYGEQKKATLTGAVSAVNNKEITTTKNENVTNMLTGKVPGLRVRQNSSEPGQFNSSIDIRGFGNPLIVVDGIPRDNMQRLDPQDIESISVVKDASAAVFGSRAANGVIIVTTKRGSKKGEPQISYSGNVGWQNPTNYPNLVGAADWMTLYNEKDRHNVDNSNPTLKYSPEEIEAYRSGEKQSTDWKKEVLRQSAPQQQHTISATGGSDKVTYYTSLGYQYQGSFLKTDAINYKKYNLRSNITAHVTKDLQFDLNLAGLSDTREQPPYGSNDIIRSMWLQRPMDQVYYNEEEGKYGMMDWNTIINPVAMMDTKLVGQNSYKSRWFQSSAALTYSIPFVKGLSLRGFYSYDYTENDNKEYTKAFTLYKPDGTPYLANAQSPGSGVTANSKTSRFFYAKNNDLWRLQISFERDFGNHYINFFNLLENSHYRGDSFYGSRYGVLPVDQIFSGITTAQQILQSQDPKTLYNYANRASVGRASYNFKGKYLAEFSYRYEGSSKFPVDKRWGFFPALSAGWRISDEDFWRNSKASVVDNLKLRASYGVTGDDSGLSYQFVSGYNYPVSGSGIGRTTLPPGYIFGNSFISGSASTGIPNRNITWSQSKTANIGLDADAKAGLIGITVEIFQRNRTGLLTYRSESLPGIVGAALPQENLNSDQNRGFEIEIRHQKTFGNFSYQVKGNMSYTMIRTKHYEMARQGNSYLNWRNELNDRNNNIWWGYAGNGVMQNWDDVQYNPVYVARNAVPGDYQYQDWNGDGYISDLDVHPIANTGAIPLVNYGITVSAQWKGFDLTALFQGASAKYVSQREFLYQPLWSNTNAVSDFMDRWHPTDPNADPYNPATEYTPGRYAFTGSSPNATSDFNVQNAAYLRLKTLELGYTIPANILGKIKIQKVRIYGNAYNMLTFTKLKYIDPEFYINNDLTRAGLTDLGYNYPINKTYSIGLNVTF